jgi:large subunit ribosomal protein L9
VKVVFLEDVPGTANIGDIKEVKPGFARNFLLPRHLAAPATPAIVKSAEQRAVRESKLQEARDNAARSVADKLDGTAYEIRVKAGASGKLFGSVGTADIAPRVAETISAEVERQQVVLQEPIKELGDYPIVVKLTKNVTATVNVSVIGEDGTTAADIRARQDAESGRTAEAAPVAEASSEDEVAETAEDEAAEAADDTDEGVEEE